MDYPPRVSEYLYVGLCIYIGTPTEVTIRREVIDMKEKIINLVRRNEHSISMLSGSFREGFRFTTSDLDTMFWCPFDKVIIDDELSHIKSYDDCNLNVILMEDSETPHGFVKLRLLTPIRCAKMSFSVEKCNGDCYISNEKYRRFYYHHFIDYMICIDILRYHGPCLNFISGTTEHDYVHCFACQYWPKMAQSFIARSQQSGWPVQTVLKDVISDGCHVIPIAKNNMFQHKIVGSAREALLSQLIGYYEMGVSCLLLSPTLHSMISKASCNPWMFVIPFSAGHMMYMGRPDECIRSEIRGQVRRMSIEESILKLSSISALSQEPLSQFQSLVLQDTTADVLVDMAFTLANCFASFTNKTCYTLDKTITDLLRLSSRIGYLSQILYLAVYYYKTGRYKKVRNITNRCQQKFSQPFVIHGAGKVDNQQYSKKVSRYSLSKRLRKTWVCLVVIRGPYPYLEELYLEQNVCEENKLDLFISPFVIVFMLRVLSNFRLGDMSQCLQSLTDLQTLLLSDDSAYVDLNTRDISWQILGICQHVVGDLHGALQSYLMSMRQKPFHNLHRATATRIGCALQRLL